MPGEPWKKYAEEQPAATGKPWEKYGAVGATEQKPLPNEQIRGMGDEFLDVLGGIGAGVISTGVGAYNLARKIPVVGEMLPAPNQYVEDLTKAPDSLAGAAGKMGEQVAEFALPMTKVTALAKGLPLAGKLAAEAATAGGIAGVQTGGDHTAMALSAGTQGVFGALASKAPAASKGAEDMLRESGLKQYGQALLRGGGTNKNKAITERIVPELIERGETAFTLKGLAEKAGANVREAGVAIGNAFDSLPADARINVGAVEDAITNASDKSFRNLVSTTGELVSKGPEAAAGERHVNRILQALRDHAEVDPATGERFISAANARSLRQYYDEIAAKGGAYTTESFADASKIAANKLAANSMREELAKTFPEIAKLNKEYSFWRNVEQVSEDTILRKQGHGKGLGDTIRGAAGGAAGFTAGGVHGMVIGKAALESLGRMAGSTAWKTISPVVKDRLADALASGNRGAAEHLIRTIGVSILSAEARRKGGQTAAPPPEDKPHEFVISQQGR